MNSFLGFMWGLFGTQKTKKLRKSLDKILTMCFTNSVGSNLKLLRCVLSLNFKRIISHCAEQHN